MELNLLLKYVVFTILYIEMLSFIFNPKIKTQMMMCVLILTAIASISIMFDFKYLSRLNGDKTYKTVSNICTGQDNICTSFIRSLPDIIKRQHESAPLGWAIGFLGMLNMIGILFLTIVDYDPDIILSKRNKKKVEIIKSLFVSNVFTVFVIGILSYLIFTEDKDLSFTIYGNVYNFLKNLKRTDAVIFAMLYLFGSSVYVLHESRMIYKLRVNNLHAK
jgi:RsiW-degrading membrane proteinase PrsW (M82 family)